MDISSDLAPTGTLRASVNLGNPVLAQGTPGEPSGVTVDIARELGARLGVVASRPGYPVLEPAFMEIRQALGTTRSRHADTVDYRTRAAVERDGGREALDERRQPPRRCRGGCR